MSSTMKYVILQGDGMADFPIDSLEGKTPLEAAKTPHMDWLAGPRILWPRLYDSGGVSPGQRCGEFEHSRLQLEDLLHRTGTTGSG